VNKAFVLGAGLGERLKPLTDQLPKPLIPVFHRPLITHAFDHLIDAGVDAFVVNSFHLPHEYDRAFPGNTWRGRPVTFRQETPIRLETAGGIANVRDLLESADPFIVYNGDILTDLPLAPLMREHQERGNLVTLALRSTGPALHIGLDPATGKVTDIRNKLGTGNEGTHLFTGIYIVSPAFFDYLTPGKKESVIPIFLKLIEEGRKLGGLVIDEGHWWDLGNRTSYLEAHRFIAQEDGFPAYHPIPHTLISDQARIAPGAHLTGANIIGPGAVVEAGAIIEDCILWPGATVAGSARLRHCIVRSGIQASGEHQDADL
jgi:mannose-1-phosphate guanylyltransferase